jgi:hypothetical protein
MTIRRFPLAILLGCAAAALGAQSCLAQDGKDDAVNESTDVKRCVQLNRIDHTDVVDESTLLFYMNDGKIYRNHLPIRCPQLKSEDRFMYRVSLPQLCDTDIITVLTTIGPGFMPGASCGLGRFQEISKETAAEITKDAKRDKDRD